MALFLIVYSVGLFVLGYMCRIWFVRWVVNRFPSALDGAHSAPIMLPGEAERVVLEWSPPPPMPQHRARPRAPHGYTAKEVLGYRDLGGRFHPPTFPGGLDEWDDLYN